MQTITLHPKTIWLVTFNHQFRLKLEKDKFTDNLIVVAASIDVAIVKALAIARRADKQINMKHILKVKARGNLDE